MGMHKGALHRALHVPEGQKIPAKKMAAAKRSENPHVRRMASLARTLKSINHKDGGVIHGEGESAKPRADRSPRRKR